MESSKPSLLQLIQSRRSLRRYKAEPVPHSMIEQLLQAGIWSPSAHNRQPWRFCVVEHLDNKERLANAMGARLRQDLSADHVPLDIIEKDAQRSYERITSAPLIILVCLSMNDMDVYTDERRNQKEYLMAVQSTAMAGQNILLMAEELGLGACWMCAPLFVPNVVREALELPDDWESQGMITIGFPDQEREKTREALETRVQWR